MKSEDFSDPFTLCVAAKRGENEALPSLQVLVEDFVFKFPRLGAEEPRSGT